MPHGRPTEAPRTPRGLPVRAHLRNTPWTSHGLFTGAPHTRAIHGQSVNSIGGPRTIYGRPTELSTNCLRPIRRHSMGVPQTVRGRRQGCVHRFPKESSRIVHGLCVDASRAVYELSTDCPRTPRARGSSADSPWGIRRMSVGCPWAVRRVSINSPP